MEEFFPAKGAKRSAESDPASRQTGARARKRKRKSAKCESQSGERERERILLNSKHSTLNI
jgi:hypothetical protein